MTGSENESTREVWFLSADLMMASRIQQACRASGFAMRMIGNLQAIDPSKLVSAALLIIDLQTPRWSVAVFRQLHADGQLPANVVAFAQHVDHQRLEEARSLPGLRVVTRGQLDATVDSLVAELVQSGSGD